MAKTAATARTKYLEKASSRLLLPSPAVSAYLQTVRNGLLEQEGVEKSSHDGPKICPSCGTILVPGLTCQPARLSKRSRTERLAMRGMGSKILRLKCSRCSAISTFESVKPGIVQKPNTNTDTLIRSRIRPRELASITSSSTPTLKEPVQTSRRRARSKNSTLQSMLQSQQKVVSENSKGFGLDLMDFMKT